jgi:2-(3-amino-3-carboxypropyl)histidine synthase
MEYDLELERVAKEVKQKKAKKVCIQLPDGLKPKAGKIADEIEKRTSAKVIIWAGPCFGACDTPHGLDKLGIDLLVQWGHAPWT